MNLTTIVAAEHCGVGQDICCVFLVQKLNLRAVPENAFWSCCKHDKLGQVILQQVTSGVISGRADSCTQEEIVQMVEASKKDE